MNVCYWDVENPPKRRGGIPCYWNRDSPEMQAYLREQEAWREELRGRKQWRRQLIGTAQAILRRKIIPRL